MEIACVAALLMTTPTIPVTSSVASEASVACADATGEAAGGAVAAARVGAAVGLAVGVALDPPPHAVSASDASASEAVAAMMRTVRTREVIRSGLRCRGRDEEHRCAALDHALRGAAQQRPREPAPRMRRHDHEVDV